MGGYRRPRDATAIPDYMHQTITLVAAVEMDVLGIAYHAFTPDQRHLVKRTSRNQLSIISPTAP